MRGPEVCGQDRRFTSQQLGRPWQPVTRVKSSTLVLVLPDSREQRRLRIWGKDTSQGIGGGQVWGTPEEAKGSHKRRTRSWTWALPEIWGISMALSASQTVPRVWGGILAKLFCLWPCKGCRKVSQGPALCSVLFQPSIVEGLQLRFSYISNSWQWSRHVSEVSFSSLSYSWRLFPKC